jgi:hypothetical protein
MQAFRVVRRPHLKGDEGAPLSDIMIHAYIYVMAAGIAPNIETKREMLLQREEPG